MTPHLGTEVFLQLQEDTATHTMRPGNTVLFETAGYYTNNLTSEI